MNIDRSVVHHIFGRMSALEGGEIDEGLEGRTRLADRVDGAIEGRLRVGSPAHHRAHGAVGRHRDECCLARIQPVRLLRKLAGHRALGFCLRIEIEGGLHDHVADLAFAFGELRHHPVREIARSRRPGVAHDTCARRLRQRALGVADQAAILHGSQNDLRALGRRVGIGKWIEPRRGLDASGQHRCFGQRETRGRLAEEPFRGRLDAEDAGAEIDAVEIEGEDLVLAVARLEIEREDGFLELAFEGAIGIQKEILRQLLRQRRAALHHMASFHIVERRARETDRINAEMIAESPVLDGDKGVGDVRRKRCHVDDCAMRHAALRDYPTLVVENGDVVRRPARHHCANVGQIRKKAREEDGPEDQTPGRDDRQQIGPGATPARRGLRRIGVVDRHQVARI